MEFRNVLARRRMHRAFLPDPLPRETLERIAASVRRAPSGGFSQGQSLVVVTEPERERIAAAMDEHLYVEKGWPPFMTTAPAHIVVCASEARYHERYNKPDKLAESGGVEIHWPVPYWYVDAGAAMITVLLAAIDEGARRRVHGPSGAGGAAARHPRPAGRRRPDRRRLRRSAGPRPEVGHCVCRLPRTA